MQEPLLFYQEQIQEHTLAKAKIKKQLMLLSMLRLAIFLSAVLGMYFLWEITQWVMAIAVVGVATYLFLLSKHTNVKHKKNTLEALLAINKIEVAVQNRDFYTLPDGDEFKDPLHFFSHDIDLFGKGSFYQYSNRTALKEGSALLAKFLTENSIENIEDKQAGILELSKHPKWRQQYTASAMLGATETSVASILLWIKSYSSFVPKIVSYGKWVFSAISLMIIGAIYFGQVKESLLIYWLIAGLVITGIFAGKVAKLTSGTSKMRAVFQQYNQLLLLIENIDFTSSILSIKKESILSDGRKASQVLKDFSGLLSKMDQNNNLIYMIFGNGLFLTGLGTALKIEDWLKEHKDSVAQWFEVIAFFDAYNSLGNFTFNHPTYHFPKILEDSTTALRSEKSGHPLLDPKKTIWNSFEMENGDFFIITGANMAGKSTFLRTVSLQIVLANVGLPVCATSLEYTPIKLITSMRTTDSLTDDASYFFSELKRLKFIVDEIATDRYFIVLDEILKGTNSIDKAKGSRKFVERLAASNSTGIIATHDLSLCEAAKEQPQIKNYYFDAEIIDDELHFDYLLKNGICQNMNASFLLKKMKIVE